MKKFFSILILSILLLSVEVVNAQLAKDSWSVGFGLRYPRLVSINSNPLKWNYGGFVSLQRNFSEHVALRFKAGYSLMKSEFIDVNSIIQTNTTSGITGDLDLMYYLAPCEPVSPYLFGGFGAFYRMLSNVQSPVQYDDDLVAQVGFGLGIEMALDDSWKLLTEFGYHITGNSELEGVKGAGEVNGKDTYLGISIGLLYFLDKGEPSKYCQLYSGISQDMKEMKDMTDYDKIEGMIKKHIPKEVTKEVLVEKPTTSISEKWILVGVNFDFNSTKLLAESYPILYDVAKTMLRNPDMKIEIQGYTDNIGSEDYNKKLGQRRADAVKDYLTSKGIYANRLRTVSFGESIPVADNNTEDGRALNRRIEFKMQ